MAKLIVFMTAVYTTSAFSTCQLKPFNIGRGMAIREFAKWDKNCTTLEVFYEDMLTRDPTEKCLRRGYWDKAQDLYEQHSVDCNSVKCEGIGKKLGEIIGQAFCNREVVNTTLSVCNAREKSICGDVFFDYAFDNCNEAQVTNGYQDYDRYLEYCNQVIFLF